MIELGKCLSPGGLGWRVTQANARLKRRRRSFLDGLTALADRELRASRLPATIAASPIPARNSPVRGDFAMVQRIACVHGNGTSVGRRVRSRKATTRGHASA